MRKDRRYAAANRRAIDPDLNGRHAEDISIRELLTDLGFDAGEAWHHRVGAVQIAGDTEGVRIGDNARVGDDDRRRRMRSMASKAKQPAVIISGRYIVD